MNTLGSSAEVADELAGLCRCVGALDWVAFLLGGCVMTLLTRRSILTGLIAAPVVVAAGSLMPLHGVPLRNFFQPRGKVLITADVVGWHADSWDRWVELGADFGSMSFWMKAANPEMEVEKLKQRYDKDVEVAFVSGDWHWVQMTPKDWEGT